MALTKFEPLSVNRRFGKPCDMKISKNIALAVVTSSHALSGITVTNLEKLSITTNKYTYRSSEGVEGPQKSNDTTSHLYFGHGLNFQVNLINLNGILFLICMLGHRDEPRTFCAQRSVPVS